MGPDGTRWDLMGLMRPDGTDGPSVLPEGGRPLLQQPLSCDPAAVDHIGPGQNHYSKQHLRHKDNRETFPFGSCTGEISALKQISDLKEDVNILSTHS